MLDKDVRCSGIEVTHDFHPAIPLSQVSETNSKTQEWDEFSNGVLPCTMGAQKGKSSQGQTGVWEGFLGGPGEATPLMKRRSGKAGTQTFLEVGGGLSALWGSAFAIFGPCPLTADADSPCQRVNGREASLGTFST